MDTEIYKLIVVLILPLIIEKLYISYIPRTRSLYEKAKRGENIEELMRGLTYPDLIELAYKENPKNIRWCMYG